MLGNYNKITNSTYTSTGRLLGKGNLIQLLIK